MKIENIRSQSDSIALPAPLLLKRGDAGQLLFHDGAGEGEIENAHVGIVITERTHKKNDLRLRKPMSFSTSVD
jgi:hypothetical protein